MIVEEKYNIDKHFLIVNDIEVYPEEESLKDYLLMDAHKDMQNHLSQTYLLFDDDVLVGYYTLKTFGFAIREEDNDRLTYYPCVELSQILVDINYRYKGLGGLMIKSALKKAIQISSIVGCKLLITFSLDDKSTNFYTRLGFKGFEAIDKNKESLLLSETGYHDGLPMLGIEIS